MVHAGVSRGKIKVNQMKARAKQFLGLVLKDELAEHHKTCVVRHD
jgi:hypothetical protein